MRWKRQILALLTVMCLPTWLLGADGQDLTAESRTEEEAGQPALYPKLDFDSSGDLAMLTRGQSPYRRDTAVRFGWWATSRSGDMTKVEEWQDLDSSPFFDVDGIFSDGSRTVDYFVTGTDNETLDSGIYAYYGPRLSVDVDFQRFRHRLDHDPLDNFLGAFDQAPHFDAADNLVAGTPDNNRLMLSQDLDPNGEYAVRVTEVETDFKGRLTENIRWRLNFWSMRKSGERQASSQSHCFNGDTVDIGVPTNPTVPAGARACHVLSQRQRIDWLTTQLEPVVEATFGPVSVEYSHLLRTFDQADQFVRRNHTTNNTSRSIGDGGVTDGAVDLDPGSVGTNVGYGVVPENITQTDRLKIGVDLTENTDVYTHLFNGNTENRSRDTNRHFYGYDVRLTNRSIDGVTVTGYSKQFKENNQDAPWDAVDGTEILPNPAFYPRVDDTFRVRPWDRQKTSSGVKALWRRCGTARHSLTASYDYTDLQRDHTLHLTERPDDEYIVGDTITNTYKVGSLMRWNPCVRTKLYYTRKDIHNPMFASHEANGTVNSSLPTDADLVELWATWTPSYNFLVSAMVGIENQNHSSTVISEHGTQRDIRFDEDNYPYIINAWYAPTSKWSLTAGYGHFSNWINQDINLGDQLGPPAVHTADHRHNLVTYNTPFNYSGESSVVDIGTSYAHSECLTLSGNVGYTRSKNAFDPITPPAQYGPDSYYAGDPPGDPDWTGVENLSDVVVETWRITAGVDYWLTDGITCYFRYNFFDYEDKSVDRNSGTGHMFLAGLTAMY